MDAYFSDQGLPTTVLGGSWALLSRVMSTRNKVMTIVTLLRTQL